LLRELKSLDSATGKATKSGNNINLVIPEVAGIETWDQNFAGVVKMAVGCIMGV